MHSLATVSLQALRAQTPEAQALQAMTAALRAGHPLAVAYSGGKDSSVLANLALAAACEVQAEGCRAVLAVTHADVGAVENPEIRALARDELACMRRFAAAKGLDLRVRIARPALSESFAVRVIGGRALPAFPDSRRDCTSSWKREPSERVLRRLASDLAREGWREPVLMTGVRRDESTVRAGSIARRGETAARLWQDREGRLRLSPLLDWTVDDVWSYLGLCRQGAIESYSSFDEVLRVYQDAGGSSCVVVADAEMERHAKPCASRFGCWACTAVREDRSLRQMIDSDPARYGYLRPLAALRDFIAHSQYDWDRRQFIGRTIRNGFITIAADTYAPSMLAELLRYALSAQKATGIEIVSAAQIIAIDARWSLYALAEPFAALRIWREVERGGRWSPPAIAPVPKTPVPRYGLIHVGGDWDDEIRSDLVDTGLRDSAWELFTDSCGPSRRTLRNGRSVIDIGETGGVDEEAAWLFLDFEAERMLAGRTEFEDDWTQGYRTTRGTSRVAWCPRREVAASGRAMCSGRGAGGVRHRNDARIRPEVEPAEQVVLAGCHRADLDGVPGMDACDLAFTESARRHQVTRAQGTLAGEPDKAQRARRNVLGDRQFLERVAEALAADELGRRAGGLVDLRTVGLRVSVQELIELALGAQLAAGIQALDGDPGPQGQVLEGGRRHVNAPVRGWRLLPPHPRRSAPTAGRFAGCRSPRVRSRVRGGARLQPGRCARPRP